MQKKMLIVALVLVFVFSTLALANGSICVYSNRGETETVSATVVKDGHNSSIVVFKNSGNRSISGLVEMNGESYNRHRFSVKAAGTSEYRFGFIISEVNITMCAPD